MNKLIEYWYSALKPVPGKSFYNYCLESQSLCVNSLSTVLNEDFTAEQKVILNCVAFQVVQEEIAELLFGLRRASYPPQDPYDSDKLYDLEQMIKVAKHFDITFISELLEEAKRIHTA